MKFSISPFWVACVLLCGCGSASQDVPQLEKPSLSIPSAIEQKLNAQELAWNQGDLGRFMEEAYWADDQLMFIGSRGLTYGYDQTLANYQKSYPDPNAMGTLVFELLQWKPLGNTHGLLVGSWLLKRSGELENLDGHFSLIWEKKSEGWVIIADHSS